MNAVHIKAIIRYNQVYSDSCFTFPPFQMVVLMDPMEDPDDILRAHRSREKTYMFDVAFDYSATQASPFFICVFVCLQGWHMYIQVMFMQLFVFTVLLCLLCLNER